MRSIFLEVKVRDLVAVQRRNAGRRRQKNKTLRSNKKLCEATNYGKCGAFFSRSRSVTLSRSSGETLAAGGKKINQVSQFQKYWLSRVNHLFFRASKPFRRTNPDFFTKNGKKSNFGPFSSSPVNAGCSRYPVVYVSLISSIQAC